jgi:hypothetical protein
VKIVGGFKSDRRRLIRYANGTQEENAYGQAAIAMAFGIEPTGVATKAPWWRRIGRSQ